MNLIDSLTRPDLFRERALVGNRWISVEPDRSIAVRNPATGLVVGCVPSPAAHEVQQAIADAADPWPAWRTRIAKQRGSILRR